MKRSYLFGPWEPDQPPHLTKGLITARNVYPGPNGYRPVRAFQAITTPMMVEQGTDFRGGAAFVASDGSSVTLAATENALYSYSGTWNILYGSFALGEAQRWRFAQFGDLAICVQGSTPVKVDLVTGTPGLLGGDPPTADLVTVVRDFVVLGRCDGDQSMVTWSAFNDAEGWAAGTDQSGFQPMLTGGPVMGLAGGEYGLILQRNRIVRMSYLGSEPWFQFDEISSNIGCDAEGSVVQTGKLVFFHSDRGFMVCDGAGEPRPIGEERVNRTFASAYARSDYSRLYAAVDPINTLVFWVILNRIWVYNWTQDRWTDIEMDAKAVFSGFTFDTYADAMGIADIDASSLYVDDPQFQGGDPLLVVVNSANELGVLTGDTLEATFRQPFLEIVPGRVARLRRARPLTDATEGLTLTVDARARLGDSANERSFTSLTASGDMPVRSAARYQQPSLRIAAGSQWTYCQGFEAEFEAGGAR